MKILVFAGPSLTRPLPPVSGEEIILFPPAGQCDIISAVHRLDPDVVVIADGMSVLHKELIWVLSKGVRIIGTAAGGALRAAELAFCGMKGHGWVYDMTVAGLIEDDAEVFCTWAKNGTEYIRLTEPLVNIRATLQLPEVQEAIGKNDADAILAAARAIYYKNRTFSALEAGLADAGINAKRVATLMERLKENYCDVQSDDLADTLERISQTGFLPAPMNPETMPVPIDDQGAIFRMLYDHDRIVEDEGQQMRLYEIGNFVTTRHPDMEHLAYNAFNRELVLVLADQTGIGVCDEEVATVTETFRRISGLTQEDTLASWLVANDLSREDFSILMRDETRIKKLQESFLAGQMFQKNTRPVLDLLRLTHAYPGWRSKAFDREKSLEGRKEQLKQDYLAEDFLALIMERHRTAPLPWKDKIQPAADAVGIGAKDLKMELIKDKRRDHTLLDQVGKALS